MQSAKTAPILKQAIISPLMPLKTAIVKVAVMMRKNRGYLAMAVPALP